MGTNLEEGVFLNAFTQTTSDPGSKLFLVKANFINQIVLLCFNSWYEISMRYRPFKDHKFFETVTVKLQSTQSNNDSIFVTFLCTYIFFPRSSVALGFDN